MSALRLLLTCPLLPLDAFVHLAGMRSASGAYRQLAKLKMAGLAEVERADLGYLLGERPVGLWKITARGRLVLEAYVAEPRNAESLISGHAVHEPASRTSPRDATLPLLAAAYRLLAWVIAERAVYGQDLEVDSWEQPFVRDVPCWTRVSDCVSSCQPAACSLPVNQGSAARR